jgi:uncharacterized surface protein with fasciclin (FAS1) repeats
MLNKYRTIVVGLVLSVALLFPACDKTWEDHYETIDETTQKDKVLSEMEKIPEISEFTNAVKRIDSLVDLLNQSRLYTVFAPKNEAFNNIDPEIINDETFFTRMVLYHFIDGKKKYKDLSYDEISTFNTKFLSVSLDNSNKVLLDGTAAIVQQDFLSQNGMIQVINKPLLPKDNLNEYFMYNEYTSKLADAIESFTIREFDAGASEPVGKNDQGEIIYDSVFNYYNPFLSTDVLDAPVDFYGQSISSYQDIADESSLYTCVFPINYENALSTVKSSPFLNSSIADNHWSGALLSGLMFSRMDPYQYFSTGVYTKQQYVSAINSSQQDEDEIEIMLYVGDLLKNNFTESINLSNGIIHLVDGFEYDMGWLIKEQGQLGKDEKEKDYRTNLLSNLTKSDNVDTAIVESNNIKTIFYFDTITNDYTSVYGEWVSFDFEGIFYPVDYEVMVRGRNVASGTFTVEVDGTEIGQFDFSAAPSGDNDKEFDVIGTASFTEIKSTTNLKLTFANTHPEDNKGEQYLWIREIKFSPVIE